MLIIGCDFHSRFQRIAMLDSQSGELIERRLEHETGEARAFYASVPGVARVGAWRPRVTVNGLKPCWPGKGMSCGWGTRLRSVRRWCGSRRRTPATLVICWTCC